MEPLFSEFSYGYALTQEFAAGRFGNLIGAPVFPSLYQEGQRGGGYDVVLPFMGAPLFLQFKLSHYLWRSNASEWAVFNSAYYRMYLRPLRHSPQHDLLMQLEADSNEVYYAAPAFHTVDELNSAYIAGNVIDRTAFFSPSDIGPLDINQHYLVFQAGTVAHLYSEKQRTLDRFYFGKNFVDARYTILMERKAKIDDHFFDRISNQIIEIVQKRKYKVNRLKEFQASLPEKGRSLMDKAYFATYLSRVFLDSELFIISEKPRN